MPGAVGVGGVEKADAEIERTSQRPERLTVLRSCRTEGLLITPDRSADRPAAQPESADFNSASTEISFHEEEDGLRTGRLAR